MERKLASVQIITSLSPIKDADLIEKATVLGWECVVAKKDNFKVGDKVVYCEVDSILPDKPEFEFLRERKFRIRTIKLKGQISQGIVFPLSILPKKNINEGDNVTDILGIIKYDPQAEFERKETLRLASLDKNRMTKFLKRYSWYRNLFFRPTRIPFPSFIKKTDEDRIQLFPNACEQWGNYAFDVTEKLDGQSATYFMIPNPRKWLFGKKWIFGVCSRNFQLLKPDNSSYWTLAKELCLEAKMWHWCEKNNKGLIIQGEAIGVGIQGNKYNVPSGFSLFVFNVATYDKGVRVNFNQNEQSNLCLELSLRPVPWIKHNHMLPLSIHLIVESAKGISNIANILREGLVYRDYHNDISFKVINPDFLLKYQE
jgi:hypothetical protein